MYKHISLSLLLVASLIYSGCGSSSSSTDTTSLKSEQSSTQSSSLESKSSTKNRSGVFIDAAVAGLSYSCLPSTMGGLTTKEGYFTCKEGDTISFYIAQNFIGSSPIKDVITPYDLLDGDGAINLAQLLQTLDSDGNVDNGIVIDSDMAGKLLDKEIDFKATDFDTTIQDLLEQSLVDETEAKNHMDTSIASFRPNPATSVSSSTSSSASSKPSGSHTQSSQSSTKAQSSLASHTTTTSKPSANTQGSSSSASYCQQNPYADVCNIALATPSSSSSSSSSGGIDYGAIGENIAKANSSSSASSSSSTPAVDLNVSICDINPTAPECLSLSTEPLIALASIKGRKLVPTYFAQSRFRLAYGHEDIENSSSKMLALCRSFYGATTTLAPKEILEQMVDIGYGLSDLRASLSNVGSASVVDSKGNRYSLFLDESGEITIEKGALLDETNAVVCYVKGY